MASRKLTSSSGSSETKRNVITLDDLAPRHDVRGGSERRVFGADTNTLESESHMAGKKVKKNKDLAPKSTGKVKGGKLAANESLTLVRAAGKKVKSKDLAPKSTGKVKGGRLVGNENLTLVRAQG